ncbi:MAG: NADPH:quinone oxidoreductase family protein [Candidatus Competibacteraceae bacterium]|nr:NADPH:quinone oxidoreductase family protein [Candidatus Competibacteraceae bacterium]
MRAVVCKQWGMPPDNLVLEELPSPIPEKDQVAIAVHACGINFADTLIAQGKYQTKPEPPFSPGMEVAGEVLACGSEVKTLKPGDRVMAVLSYGGFAEEVIAPAAAVVPLPTSMDFVTAAGFPVAYGTSHLALTRRAHLQPGENLLVHGAGGGVGLTAVEIGKQLGATVIATAGGADKLKIAAEHGADHLIDYSKEDIRERVKALGGADVVYDPVGGDAFDASLRCINWEGRILAIGFASGKVPQPPANILLVKNCAVIGLYWGAYLWRNPPIMQNSLSELLSWHAQGKLKPHVSRTYPLEQAQEALADLLARRSTGKLVLTMC